jgi:hypothetical protein
MLGWIGRFVKGIRERNSEDRNEKEKKGDGRERSGGLSVKPESPRDGV